MGDPESVVEHDRLRGEVLISSVLSAGSGGTIPVQERPAQELPMGLGFDALETARSS